MTNLLGILTVTAYCFTGRLAANNRPPVAGVTCAAARSIPFGTVLVVAGRPWIVTDRLSRRFDSRVDLCFGTNTVAARKWGKRKLAVEIVQ